MVRREAAILLSKLAVMNEAYAMEMVQRGAVPSLIANLLTPGELQSMNSVIF